MLEKFVVGELFAFLMIFCRVGSGLMVMPGFGESFVLARARLLLALTISALLTPPLRAFMPPIPVSPLSLLVLMLAEILVGLFIGTICRILIGAIHVAGMVIAYQSSLASAFMIDISLAGQTTALGNFLTVTAMTLLFTTDLHHLMLRGLTDSYTLFPPGAFPPVEDFANLATTTVSRTFKVAIQISSPFLVIGLIAYLVAGIISRLMPAMQIFFLMMPVQILVSFLLLIMTLSAMMLWFTSYFEATLTGFLSPQ